MSTAFRLIADDLRRAPTNAIVSIALVMMGWGGVVSGRDPQGPAAFSMAIVAVLSLIATTSFVQRPVYYLPVSRREIWQAQWLLSTCVATLFTTTGKLLGILLPQPRGIVLADGGMAIGPALEPVLLSALCDFAYGGSFPATLVLMRLVSRKAGRGLITNVAFALLCVWFIGGVAWGFLIRSRLPLRWEDLLGWQGAALAAGLVIAWLALGHSPPAIARAALPRTAGPRWTAANAQPSRRRLSGTAMLIVREVVITAAVATVGFLVLFSVRALTLPGGLLEAFADLRNALVVSRTIYLAGVIPMPAT